MPVGWYVQHNCPPPGTKVYCTVKHVSHSGMQRTISFFIVDRKDGSLDTMNGWIARALGMPFDHKRGGVKVSGCGMDMGFHVVHSLSYALHGMEAKGEGVAADDRGVPFTKARRGHFRAGYSLLHEWL